jgi:hypothetical protein
VCISGRISGGKTWLCGVRSSRALGLVRGCQRDLDRNRAAMQAVRQDLTRRGYGLTEVRILDLLILSTQAAA